MTRGTLAAASVKPGRLSWMLWLVPVGAIGICIWFFYRDYIATGPLITIYFQNAEGLQKENTQVMYRGATVGQVKSIDLTGDNQHVKVKARLAGSAKNLARAGSLFWIVRPEVRLGSISGLRTIVSGEYVTVEPGTGPPTNSFVAAEEPPIPDEPQALQITLLAGNLGSLQKQSPVFYRGVQVGEVVYYQLGADARQVAIHARIWHEYAPLVRVESKFWNAGGLDIHFGLFKGVQISAESPKTVISGGIEFATPTDFQTGATNGAVFVLNEKPGEKWTSWAPSISLNLPQQAVRTNAPAQSFLK
jgi:paraquat-inducible protein B